MNDGMEDSHLIELPIDEDIKSRLLLKLEEYKKRVAGEGKPWKFQHPELVYRTYHGYRDACYKAYILEAILKANGSVDTWQVAKELATQWKGVFDPDTFCCACEVIVCYCENDLSGIKSGTGLPEKASA